MIVLKLFFCIGIYIGVALLVYIIMNKIDPYDPAADYYGDGDSNKVVACFWPCLIIFSPVLIIAGAIRVLCKFMDMINQYQNGGTDNEGNAAD